MRITCIYLYACVHVLLNFIEYICSVCSTLYMIFFFDQVSGGCEWNWGPGYIGHSVFTESMVYSARIPTEKGDIIRVWEYDRLNHSTWQVHRKYIA